MATTLEQGQKVSRGESIAPPIALLIGFVPKSIEPGHADFEMEVDQRYYNSTGQIDPL